MLTRRESSIERLTKNWRSFRAVRASRIARSSSRPPRSLVSLPELRSKYDVVVFDTSPLAAGSDAYAISAAVGNLVVVLRVGKTERRLAAAKLLLVDRLPINILGAVLNGVQLRGEFEYYGYSSGYGFAEADVAEAAPAASTTAVEAL